MENRQLGTAILAGIYAIVHYLVVAGEVLKSIGWKSLPEPLATIFHAAFWCLLAIVLAFLTPKLLRLIVWICVGLLGMVSFSAKLTDMAVDRCRLLLISGVEVVLRRLRSLDPPTRDRVE